MGSAVKVSGGLCTNFRLVLIGAVAGIGLSHLHLGPAQIRLIWQILFSTLSWRWPGA